VAGCVPRPVSVPVSAPSGTHVETVAFTTTHDRVDVLDAATSVLVSSNFTITLANERLGLMQTDYVPLSLVQDALADTVRVRNNRLNDLLMRITLNADPRGESTFVQVKGTFQKVTGAPVSSDNLIGLYWLERVGKEMAASLEVPYVQQLPDSTYVRALGETGPATPPSRTAGVRSAARAAGILIAVLFALTLAVGAFGPTSNTAPALAQ